MATGIIINAVIAAVSLSIADFPIDKPKFHAQASTNLALVPLSGTGTPGHPVEFRAVDQDGGYDTTAWTQIATIDGAGNWSAYATVPRSTSWYQAQVRDGSNTTITASAPKLFGTGGVYSKWGQSEDAGMAATFYESAATATTIPKLRKSIAALQYNTKLRGAQATPVAFNPASLGAGASWNAGTKTLTINSGTHNFSAVQFPDNTFIDVYGGSVGGTGCGFTTPAFSTNFAVINYRAGATNTGWTWNTFLGPGNYCDINPVIRMQIGAILTGDIAYNHIKGYPSDGIHPCVGQSGASRRPRVYRNFLEYTYNIDPTTAAYNAGTTYTLNQTVSYNGYFYAASTTTTGNAPTGTTSSNAWWTRLDPHLDPINPVGGGGGDLLVRENLIICQDTPFLIGITNTILRYDQTDAGGDVGTITVEHNRAIRGASVNSPNIQIYKSPTAALGAVIIRNNEWTSTSTGTQLHASSNGANILWGDNTDAATGSAYATPSNATAQTYADTTDADFFSVTWHNRSPEGSGAAGVQRQLVSNASYGRKQFTGAAAQWAYWRPGEKCEFILCADPGRGFGGLFDDSDTDSYWVDDFAAFNHGRAGGYVGMHIMSWYASPSGLGSSYGNAVLQLISGKRSDGSTITPRAPIYSTGTTVHCQADHLWSQIYDFTKTKVLISGPHRRDPVADLSNFETYAAGGTEFVQRNYGLCRQSVRDTFPHAQAAYVSDKGVDAINVEFGYWNAGQNDWWDNIHPAPSDDGSKRFFALSVLAALHGDGLVGWDVPEINNAYWAPGGAYMEMWSSAWTLSTTRKARGEAAMANTFPHRTEVFSVEINGVPAQNATIVNGRIRVLPNSGTFNASTVITLGEGGASGFIAYPEDAHEGGWKNSPIGLFPNGPVAGIEGISVRPKPSAAVLASTL